MSIRDRIFGDTVTAVCTTFVQSRNRFTVQQNVREAAGISSGDAVRVLIRNTDSERLIKMLDSATFTGTVHGRGQVQIPSNIVSQLQLEEGSRIQYVVLKTDKVPGASGGPVREAADPTPVEDRPRDESIMTFEARMAKTGQFTVPADIREDMNIKKGDSGILMSVQDPDDPSTEEVDTVSIGTGNRVTIKKSIREELGIEPNSDVTVTLGV